MILDMISWYKNKDAICNHVLAMEEEITKLKNKVKYREEYLEIMPPVRGKRYKDVYVPEWFQLEDRKQLTTDFINYINEACATKRPI